MKTSVLYYCAFFVVVLSSVLFGLDWQPSVLSPMAPVKVVAFAPPPPPPPVKAAVPAPSAAAPAATRPAATNPAAPRMVVPAAPNNANAPATAPVAANPPAGLTSPKPLCDVAACAAAYRSFRASDCTYNPSFGERRLCTKGVVPTEAAPGVAPGAAPDTAQPSIIQAEPGTQPSAPADVQQKAQCNVSACAAAYRSFTESDCTFLATGGLRKLCAK